MRRRAFSRDERDCAGAHQRRVSRKHRILSMISRRFAGDLCALSQRIRKKTIAPIT
jgi:hypothetical protein